MRRYYITPVKNKGRDAWMVNYPAKDNTGGRLRWRRRQNMFWNLEKARAFLQEQKREQANNGSTFLAGDSLLHCDVLRALKILATVPNASFEVAAWLLKICRGAKELRGAKYELPTNRQIELEPRAFLGCNNKARSVGIALKDLVNGIVLQWLESEAEVRVEERIAREAREERAKVGLRWKDWRERKGAREMEALHQKFREIEEEYRRRERQKKLDKEETGKWKSRSEQTCPQRSSARENTR
jgi:hypothetical protein